MIELVGGEQFGDLGRLQGVAESIFGRGQRQPGWFRRKLTRAGVDPALSAVAMRGAEVQGYVLLGRVPSLGSVARGAGVGVVAAARGSGLGRALLDFVSARARAAGFASVQFLAEPQRLDWYQRQGFVVVDAQLSLLGFGLGSGERVTTGAAAPSLAATPLWSWFPEAWERTPVEERAFVELALGRAWLTREGRAWLAQRVEPRSADSSVPQLITSLRARLATTTPLVLYPCGADAAWLGALLASGFEVAQRSHVVRRSTHP
ncbi:GNAT family N-acetyltransferase [Enhygromyxa salina]|uniref:Acetyltransferase (GNAT) family protein n=1 Tax=Enhygromyxa salina TaxID=215803 RepID=A0A2S9YNF4_9BACT|nr:GNAT family N-acetyltransferase [Enhygromyxa salina]PRQ06612.1 Acetyltransferase (GNAT) family protein [Enhygromyxa salina]